MASTLQIDLYRTGAGLFLFCCVWGCFIPTTTYKRLGLMAHSQAASMGTMAIAAGVLVQHLSTPLQEWESRIIYWGIWVSWPMIFTQIAAAYWGANKMLPIAGEAAPGASPWKENVVAAAHIAAVLGNIPAWAIICWRL
ncbi:unnamed protein product [Clonostachys rosea]|uniref:DUF4149 domain-containing protein n=1 Tax=Bionectria ochroleuca TaxID=29856 RepID=A0ABY6TS68_BIOOC|nr:unnamed protein product [Clonostachys rosea]